MGDELRPDDGGFDLATARLGDLYPSTEVLAEIGCITIAAARIDRQLALMLLAIKYPEELPVVLTWQTSRLCKVIREELTRLFEGNLLDEAVATIKAVQDVLEQRHSVAHSIWDPSPKDALFSVEILGSLKSQEQLDETLEQRGSSAQWAAYHPKANALGPNESNELARIRMNLEAIKYSLERLRFVLASALFAGSPAGAKRVMPLGLEIVTINLAEKSR